MNLIDILKKLSPELIELRRNFHQYPELGFMEFQTQEKIIAYLDNNLAEEEQLILESLLKDDQETADLFYDLSLQQSLLHLRHKYHPMLSVVDMSCCQCSMSPKQLQGSGFQTWLVLP